MNINSTSIPFAAPYLFGDSRANAGVGIGAESVDSSRIKGERVTKPVSPPEPASGGDYTQHQSRGYRVRTSHAGDETKADILMEMIHRMGGSGIYAGPGQVMNIVV